MVIPKPKYIENNLQIIKDEIDSIKCKAVCTCGCEQFKIDENVHERLEDELDYLEKEKEFFKKYNSVTIITEN